MSKRTLPPQRSGLTGLLFVFCLTALIVGLGFDLAGGARVRFWIGDQPAAAAAVGVVAVLFALLASLAARALFGGWRKKTDEGSGDGAHS